MMIVQVSEETSQIEVRRCPLAAQVGSGRFWKKGPRCVIKAT